MLSCSPSTMLEYKKNVDSIWMGVFVLYPDISYGTSQPEAGTQIKIT